MEGQTGGLEVGGIQSRAFLAAIVDSSDDAILAKDLNGTILSWNKGAERIFGYKAHEVVNKSITILLPPDRIDEEPAILERIRRGERIEHYETVRRHKDGSLLNISLTVSPVRDDTGRIVAASKIARDITPHRRSVEDLRRSEERFRVTLGSIGDGVIATDTEGRISFMNPVAERLTGWREQEAHGVPLSKVFRIINEVTREPIDNPALKVLDTNAVIGLSNQTLLISKVGTEVPIADSGAPIREAAGNTVGVVLVFRDVTAQRTAQITARRLAAIVESSDDAIVSKDLNGIITSWNRAAEQVLGYTEKEMLGRSIRVIIPEDRQHEEEEILDRMRRGLQIRHFETLRRRKDGSLVELSVTISPIKDGEGRIVGCSKIARDITERRKADKALQEAQQEVMRYASELENRVRERTHDLEKAVGELEAFSYSLSHDMRAPLRSMLGFTQAVLDDYGDKVGPTGVGFLKKVIAAGKRMDRLILDLLAFTRLSSTPVSVHEVDLEKLLRPIIQERPDFLPPTSFITIESPLLRVMGNEASLTQCLTNLLDNAVKFVAPGVTPQVRIRTEPRDATVRIWFEDNGTGIDAAGQHKLFQMFQRLHPTADYEGTGIGLAIVRKAIERIGGEAGVESEPGKGSRFWLQLPRGTGGGKA